MNEMRHVTKTIIIKNYGRRERITTFSLAIGQTFLSRPVFSVSLYKDDTLSFLPRLSNSLGFILTWDKTVADGPFNLYLGWDAQTKTFQFKL
jgi:hypothetical protein